MFAYRFLWNTTEYSIGFFTGSDGVDAVDGVDRVDGVDGIDRVDGVDGVDCVDDSDSDLVDTSHVLLFYRPLQVVVVIKKK